jgi:hypothetical protein
MKKIIIATAMTALFSTMVSANSGLADRINEARSYPNKTADNVRDARTLSSKHKRLHIEMTASELKNHQDS